MYFQTSPLNQKLSDPSFKLQENLLPIHIPLLYINNRKRIIL